MRYFTRYPRLLRLVASGLLVQTAAQLLIPSVSYALTAGPTAPEATSFEPVDTTDMVNLLSGDLTYNVPLLEVPGPEGGYPLSLAYHAGIQPEEEASWVGLGWSLNPGAISRNVNGYADDQQSAGQVTHAYWQGGQTTTYSVGVGVGLGQCASVSAGMSFSSDTYRGFGAGGYVGAGVGYGPVGLSARLSADDYGNVGLYAGVNVGAGLNGMSAGASLGISTNFQSVSVDAGVGVSASGVSIIGASISSGSNGVSMRVMGASSTIRNDRAGRIQTMSDGFSIDIPIYCAFIELGYNYTRYWSDETDVATVNGAMYYPLYYNGNYMSGGNAPFDNVAFDTYRVLDPEHENLLDNPDPDWLQGGSFPDYDNYSVVAQGLSGSMRPYAYQEALYSRNRRELQSDNTYSRLITDKPLPWDNYPMGFRFENDFSNTYRQENTEMGAGYNGTYYTFGLFRYLGVYDDTKNRLAGSKHIEYFTNANILSATGHPGFVDAHAKGFNRQALVNSYPELAQQIGGFSITNTSGVTYHFGLPAYAFDEYSRSESTVESNTYNEGTKASRYAYTWFLTAITGPDYVDRGATGVGPEDWGYWVQFNYGLWTDHYGWRNPAVDYRKDIDTETRMFTRGKKEVYYLNSIVTRTHTALFEKEIRNDSRGVTGGIQRGVTASANSTGYSGNPWWSNVELPEKFADIVNYPVYTNAKSSINGVSIFYGFKVMQLSETGAKSLRLKRIYLLNNADVPQDVESQGVGYNQENTLATGHVITFTGNYNVDQTFPILNIKSQGGNNIFDSYDVAAGLEASLKSSSIRIIDFNHDYSLTPGTANSFDVSGQHTGKLTLNSVSFKGKGGASVLPDTKFYYELGKADAQAVTLTLQRNNANVLADEQVGNIQVPLADFGKLLPGDILTFTNAGQAHYCTITRVGNPSAGVFQVRYLDDISDITTNTTFSATTTKNPPYSTTKRDWWGMYKSDFNEGLNDVAEGAGRMTTAVSGRGADVWSLRRIVSPLGSTVAIDYESDTYRKPVLERPNLVSSTEERFDGPSNAKILMTKFSLNQIKSMFKVGDMITISGLVYTQTSNMCQSEGNNYEKFYRTITDLPVEISAIEEASFPNTSPFNRGVIRYIIPNQLPAGIHFSDYNFVSLWRGYIGVPHKDVVIYGGGLRVKAVKVSANGEQQCTMYDYNSLYSENNVLLPSGVTSYEPGGFIRLDKIAMQSGTCAWPTVAQIAEYKAKFTRALPYIMALSRQIPAPGVMYEVVKVKESRTYANGTEVEAPNSWSYRFQVFQENMIGHQVDWRDLGNHLRTSNVSVKDFTSRIGSLLSTTHYGADGKKLSETVNHYLHDGLSTASYQENASLGATGYQGLLGRYNYQGVIQESFGDARECLASNGYDRKVVMTKRDAYPTILTSSTSTDFRTGLTTTTETLGFDFYSGAPTRTAITDGYGNRFVTESVPAYQQYGAMGLKVSSPGNRHMLSQIAATTTYKADAANNYLGVVSAGVQTWSNQVPVIGMTTSNPEAIAFQPDVWRPSQSYAWLPTGQSTDGLTAMNDFAAYDFAAAPQGQGDWLATSSITLYNPYSKVLEARDVNNVAAATKLGFNQTKVLMSGGPAAYQELAYTGAEETSRQPGDYFSGGVALTWAPGNGSNPGGPWGSGDATISQAYAHTGTSSLRLGPYKHGFSYLLNADGSDPGVFSVDPTKAFRVSVWASNEAAYLYYRVDNVEKGGVQASVQQRTADGWYLLELVIPPLGSRHSTLRVGCYNRSTGNLNNLNSGTSDGKVYLDDFRFQPLNAQAASYVYNPRSGQVTDILGNNNLYTHYDYTSDGKLKSIRHESMTYGGKRVADYSYYLAGALAAASLDVAATGSDITVNVPEAAGTVTITYDKGTGFQPLSTAARPFVFNASGAKWVRVRVQDQQGSVRELVKRLQ